MTAIEHVATASLATQEREFDFLLRQANVLSQSGLVPTALRAKPDDVMLVLLTGRDLGIAPTAALSLIHVIEGRVSLSAQLQLGLARAAGHDVWLEHSDAESATYAGQRHGSRRVERITWTVEQAKRANLLNKSNWKSYPEAMLRARAASNLIKVLCSEVTMGLPLVSPEYEADSELVDGEVFEGPEIASPGSVVAGVTPPGPKGDTEPGDVESSSSAPAPDTGAGDGTFTAEDEKLAGVAYEERFVDACDRQGWGADQRHALVAHATGGRTIKARNVYVDTEQNALGDAYTGVLKGRLVFGHAPDGGLRMETADANPEGIDGGEAFSE